MWRLHNISRFDGRNKDMKDLDLAFYGRQFNASYCNSGTKTINYPDGWPFTSTNRDFATQLIIPHRRIYLCAAVAYTIVSTGFNCIGSLQGVLQSHEDVVFGTASPQTPLL
jgi:hypothetical protein